MNRICELQKTDLKVSRIGLGTTNAGVDWDGADAYRIFDSYLAGGGNLIDCARIYSDWLGTERGRAERVLGDWIRHRGHHEDVVIITKGGHPELNTMNINRLSRKDMEYDLDLSLRALSVDDIDIYCFHRDDKGIPVEELIEIMEDFIRAGKIRYYGCSNWTTERMAEADAYCNKKGYRGFVINEALYNYGSAGMKPYPDKTMVTADKTMLAYHALRTENVLTSYMSLCSAFFHNLAANGEESVKNSPYYTEENLELSQRIECLMEKHDTGITQILLGFLLTRESTILPLIGAGNMEQIAAALDTFDVEFCAEEF